MKKRDNLSRLSPQPARAPGQSKPSEGVFAESSLFPTPFPPWAQNIGDCTAQNLIVGFYRWHYYRLILNPGGKLMKHPFLFIVRMSYLVIPSSLSAQIMERRR